MLLQWFCRLPCLIALLLTGLAFANDVRPPIGSKIDRLEFTDIRALERELKELGPHKAFVIVATNTTCPLVRKYLPRLKEIQQALSKESVAFICMNVAAEDTIREMASQAIDYQVPFYFVKDRDGRSAKKLGLSKTPEVVVIDQDSDIRYRGRIDDQFRIGGTLPAPHRADLLEALKDIVAGQPVRISTTEVDGCIIETNTSEAASSNSTWTSSIGALIHQKCASCHHLGTAAPFPLLTRNDVVANASTIANMVRNETMPPWYASRAHGEFQNDTSLSLSQRESLLQWISAGMPEGDTERRIDAPKFTENAWRIGDPDLIITMKEEHTVPATGFVPYKYVVLPHLFLQDTWVEAFEIKPLNPAIVHHCNMAYMTMRGASNETFITGFVPGGQPLDLGKFDNGVAYLIPGGSALGLQIHYTTTGMEQKGKIQVGLRFPRREIHKRLHHFVLDPRGWKIPPQDPAFRIEASHTLKHNANLLGMFTHMHVRGRDMTFFADGTLKDSEQRFHETLLQIPNYNFEWQLGYELAPGVKNFPKETRIRAVAHFDNSIFNPYNPDSEATVSYGPQTVDEMFNGFVFYVDNDEQLQIRVSPKNGSVVKSNSVIDNRPR